MTDGGWFKMHRSIIDNKVFADPMLLKMWIWILSKVRFAPRTITMSTGIGTVDVSLTAGQFVFGDRSASDALGMPRSSVQRRIKRLEKLGGIRVKAGHHFSIVTVVNWQTYQNPSIEDGPEAGHQRATNGPKEECKERKECSSLRRALHFDGEDWQLAEHLWGLVKTLQPTRKPPDLNRWANSIRLMREQDKRTHESIRDLFERANRDPFWQSNILSPDKLRAKFDDLQLKLTRTSNDQDKRTDASGRIRQRDYTKLSSIPSDNLANL